MRTGVAAVLFVAMSMVCLISCKDEVDESDMFTFTGQLMADYLSNDSTTTYFAYLTHKVKLSSHSQSSVYDLLSARGNYTCFAPTNDAVQQFLDSVFNTTNYDITQTPDSVAEYIVNNCLLDHDDDEALLSTGFLEGTLEKQSFAGRFVTLNFDTVAGGQAAVYIDKFSRIIATDVEVENGVVHIVDKVVAPTSSTLSTLISSTDYLQVFANLLRVTGYDQVMDVSFRDMDYEQNHPETGLGTPTETGNTPVPCPEHRDFGFTAFVEKDSLLAAKWNLNIQKDESGQITNWDEIFPQIEAQCKQYYPNATSTDYTSDENAVHQFVGYHLTNRSIPYNYLLVHYNEQGYGYSNPENLAIDVWCYYPTLSQNRILKLMEGRQIDGKRINRYVSERNWSNFAEVTVPRPGILLHNEGDNAALNGYFYTIDDVLWYDDDVPNKVLNERMRYDMCDLLPEQMSSGFRRITSGAAHRGLNIPVGYFDAMTYTSESRVVYLSAYSYTWENYQGDEYNIVGQYDVTIELPHVPYEGTYEVRLGIQNTRSRGMMQVYFGTNKNNLEAVGLPLDMRIYGDDPAGVITGWEKDSEDPDETTQIEKNMRIHGYMKAPLYYGEASTTAVNDNYRDWSRIMRKIIYTGNMDPKKTYYVRFKSVLESTETQLYLDYFEFCPKSVYNSVEEEDGW